MAAIRSPGIGSGLDVDSIVSQLMVIEQRPLLKLVEREAEYQAEISALGSLKSGVSSLQSSLADLAQTSTFSAVKATSSNSDVTGVSADENTPISNFTVTVSRLAQRHKTATTELDETDTFGGASGDGLTITVGTESFAVDLSTEKTLEEIRDAVNTDENATGVTAVVVNGDSGKQTLVFTASETGYDDRIQLSYDGKIKAKDFDFATINKDADGQTITDETELDASLEVEGIAVTRSTNEITDVVDGVIFRLEGVGEAQIDVGRDTTKISSRLQAFVSAYNNLRAQLSSLSEGDLGVDSLLLSLESRIRSVMNTQISVDGEFSYIQQVGITTAESGDLQLDADALNGAIEQDLDGLAALFADDAQGFAVKLDELLESFVEPDGLIDARIDGLSAQIDDVQTQQASVERRLLTTEERLRAQFTGLDQLVSQLQATSNFLTQQLANLPALLGQNS